MVLLLLAVLFMGVHVDPAKGGIGEQAKGGIGEQSYHQPMGVHVDQ